MRRAPLTLPGYLATYYRDFSFSPGAARRAGVKELESDVELPKTRARASREFAADRSLYRNTSTGRSYVRFVAELSGMTVRRVHIGAQHRLQLGDGPSSCARPSPPATERSAWRSPSSRSTASSPKSTRSATPAAHA